MKTKSLSDTSPDSTKPLPPQESDEDACLKLWDVYAKEAQNYDQGLVERWKNDMDGTLVFHNQSGLYSAVLTAFLIESYKNLKEDYTETTTALLRQISTRLATQTDLCNATTPAGPTVSFSPPANALACNILWFISLTLALFCAFLATFVQQWSRQFLQSITIARSPVRHARLLQFFYYGFKELRMHYVVTTIPTLLHLSLFFFFAGLVAFLSDVNPVLTALMSFALFLITLTYLVFTLFPVVILNSPYRTPLSPLAWRLKRRSRDFLKRSAITVRRAFRRIKQSLIRYYCNSTAIVFDAELQSLHDMESTQLTPLTSGDSSYTDLMDAALEASRKSDPEQNCLSIKWTLKSLSDDNELLPFVEALGDALQRPSGIRPGNFHLIYSLLKATDPQLDIISRISSLMTNCQNPWFQDEHRKRCKIACPRVFCSLAWALLKDRKLLPSLSELEAETRRFFWLPVNVFTAIDRGVENLDLDQHHATSAAALTYLAISLDLEAMLQDNAENLTYGQLRSMLGPNFARFIQIYESEDPKYDPTKLIATGDIQDLLSGVRMSRAREGLKYVQRSITCLPYDFRRIKSEFGELSNLPPHELHNPLLSLNKELSRTIELCSEKAEAEKGDVTRTMRDLDYIFETLLDDCKPANSYLIAQYVAQRASFSGFTSMSLTFHTLKNKLQIWNIMNDPPKNGGPEWSIALQELILCSSSIDQWSEDFDRFCSDTLLSLKHGRLSADRICLGFIIKFLALSRLTESYEITRSRTISCVRQDIIYDSDFTYTTSESDLWSKFRNRSRVEHEFFLERILTAVIDPSMAVERVGGVTAEGDSSLVAKKSIRLYTTFDGERLTDGDFKILGTAAAGLHIVVNGDLYIGGKVDLGRDLVVMGNCSVDTSGQLSIGGNLITGGIPLMRGVTVVGGDIKSSKDICVDGTLSLGGSLQTDGCLNVTSADATVSVGGNLGVFRDVHVDGTMDILGQVAHVGRSLFASASSNVTTPELRVDGDVYVNGRLVTQMDLFAVGQFQYGGYVNVGGNATICTQPVGLREGELSVTGVLDTCNDVIDMEESCPALLLQLLRNLDSTAHPRELRSALEYFFHAGLALPMSETYHLQLESSPTCAFELAKYTKQLCTVLISNIDSDILDIVKIMWKLFAIAFAFMELNHQEFTANSIGWAHPLIGAAEILLSPEILDKIKDVEKTRWKQRQTQAYVPVNYGFSLIDLAEKMMNAIKSAPDMLPLLTPLPEKMNDEDL